MRVPEVLEKSKILTLTHKIMHPKKEWSFPMNQNDNQQEAVQTPVVTFSNIPLDDDIGPVGYDSLPPEALEIPVVDIQFKKGGKIYYFDPGRLTVSTGDEVIIDTARGAEYGFCAGGNHTISQDEVISPLRPVIRVATEHDKRLRKEFKEKEPAAFEVCQKKIAEHNLEMKLVSAEYSFDGSKILFYFTADGRVDFRDLVKDLAGVFRTRIELRQIGVRDEAKMLGGLGICGRPFCCKQFLDDFQPVSIKMAKTQNLSLNPTKISGTCGRLMCCLKYEQEAYEFLIKTSPKTDSVVNTCDGVGTVTDSNLLKQTVKVRLDSDPTNIKCYQNCDICVLRNGKAKKNDPPIPTDLPPLPKPQEQPPEQDTITFFDESTLSNYTADSPDPRPERTEKTDRTDRSRRNNRPKSDRPKSQNRSNKKPQQKVEAAAPQRSGEQKSGEPKKNNARRRYYRGKKSGGNTQG
jgi:cell fate regulator YaaT (PSP1 superfamily)